jgi:lipopolysaccharide transport system ATP-binding protein
VSTTHPAISCDRLGKAYRIGVRYARSETLFGTVLDWARNPIRNARDLRRLNTAGTVDEAQDTIWAVRNVSFEVAPGEIVGIIGRNGAGKSTLLKLLSRITDPTEGRAIVRGRLASLLEVGTGFHPELTGRDNIYMNGSILGMSRREINERFDAIVDFSGVARFLDTPIKRYSSGMKTRLAFSVAAHLEPDVLVIDEVLAVGDVEFQKRCLGKMESVARSGRTVLFVSHNMPAVESLCRRGMLLRGGRVVFDGDVRSAIREYLRDMESIAAVDLSARTDRTGNGEARMRRIEIHGGTAEQPSELRTGGPASIVFHLSSTRHDLNCSFAILDGGDYPVAVFDGRRSEEAPTRGGESTVRVCSIPELPLLPGRYRVDASLHAGAQLVDHVLSAAAFDVLTSGVQYARGGGGRSGGLYVRHAWSRSPVGAAVAQ